MSAVFFQSWPQYVAEVWDCCTQMKRGSETIHCPLDSMSSAVPLHCMGGPAVLVPCVSMSTTKSCEIPLHQCHHDKVPLISCTW